MTKLSNLTDEEKKERRKQQIRDAHQRYKEQGRPKSSQSKEYFKDYYEKNRDKILTSLRDKYKEQQKNNLIKKLKEKCGIIINESVSQTST